MYDKRRTICRSFTIGFSLFAFLTLVLTSQLSFGQEKAKAILMDEMGRTSCADLQTRFSNSLHDALKDSNSNGYAIIYGKKKDLFENLRYENWINGIIEGNIDKNRIKVTRGKERDKLVVQVWKVPVDSSEQFFSEAEWSYALSSSTKPFVFTNSLPDSALCPSTSYVKLFADFLIANPNARGHLVIRDKESRNIRQAEKEVLDELMNQNKIPRRRLKLFYVKDKDYGFEYTDVEFWFVPKSKNR